MTEQPIGPILDGLGMTLELDDGDLAMGSSEGLSWIEQNGLISSAQQIINQTEIGRKGGEL